MSRDRSDTVQITLIGALASMIAVGLATAGIWPQIQAGYPQDSYWTLGWTGRAGVAAISACGIAGFFLVMARKTRIILNWKRQATSTAWALIDVAVGLLMFAVLYSTSPQVFYSFYRLIFPDLPQQWVIEGLLDTARLKMIAEMNPAGSLSDHLAGITLWAILPFTAWLHLRFWWRGGPERGQITKR